MADIKSIDDIRAEYKMIRENLSTMSKTTQDLEDLSTEGVEATIYKQDGETKLIDLMGYMEMGNVKEEYYFYNRELFFLFSKEIHFNAPPTTKYFDESLMSVSENRYYFINGKMVRWLQDKESMSESSSEYQKRENDILEFVKLLQKKLK